jgi:phosphatidylglycerophosphatase A
MDLAQNPAATAPKLVDWRFLLRHPAHFIALGAGSGLSRVAPGTAGTLWAWLSFLLLQVALPDLPWGWVLLASTAGGWWACTVTARAAGVADPGFIVWDEVVAFWLILWVLSPASGLMQVLAFALFRYFDAAKPGPVGWADRAFHGGGWRGGFGIMLDDLVAAGCTLLVMAVGTALWRAWA